LVACREYSPDWLIEDFIGWAGLDRRACPDPEDIRVYLKEARPADSSPQQANRVLREWSEQLNEGLADSFISVPAVGAKSTSSDEPRR